MPVCRILKKNMVFGLDEIHLWIKADCLNCFFLEWF